MKDRYVFFFFFFEFLRLTSVKINIIFVIQYYFSETIRIKLASHTYQLSNIIMYFIHDDKSNIVFSFSLFYRDYSGTVACNYIYLPFLQINRVILKTCDTRMYNI